MESKPADSPLPTAGAAPGRAWLAPMALLVLLYTVFWALSLYAVPMGDDWRIIISATQGGSFQEAIKLYRTFNPRLMEDLLAWTCGLPDPMAVWKALNPLFILWLCHSMVDIAADTDRLTRSRYLWLLLACSLFFFSVGGNRAWSQFWMSGSANWLWSHAFIAAMFAGLVRACRGKQMGWWRILLLFVCGIVAGWSTETSALSVAALFGLLALFQCRKGRVKPFLAAGAGLAIGLAFFFGSIFFIIGLEQRAQNYGAASLAFNQLGLWDKITQPVPSALCNAALPAALLFCIAARCNGGAPLQNALLRLSSKFTTSTAPATVCSWVLQGVCLYFLLDLYRIHAGRAAGIPTDIIFFLWLLLGLKYRPAEGAAAMGIPKAKIWMAAAFTLAVLPLPVMRDWCSHAGLFLPCLVLLTACLYYAARFRTLHLAAMCMAGWLLALPLLFVDAITLYGLNHHTAAVFEYAERAKAAGDTVVVLPGMEGYVPEFGTYPYLMDVHIRPYTWRMGTDPEAPINSWVRQGLGLPPDRRVIFCIMEDAPAIW